MLIIPFIRFRRKRPPIAAVEGPVLVAVSFDDEGPSLTLTFDRDVEVGTWDGTQLILHDGVHTHLSYNGTGGLGSVDANQVQVYLTDTGAFGGATTTLTATATTGIRESPDGPPWAGVSGYVV